MKLWNTVILSVGRVNSFGESKLILVITTLMPCDRITSKHFPTMFVLSATSYYNWSIVRNNIIQQLCETETEQHVQYLVLEVIW